MGFNYWAMRWRAVPLAPDDSPILGKWRLYIFFFGIFFPLILSFYK